MRALQRNNGATEFVLHNQHGQAGIACMVQRGIKLGGVDLHEAGGLEKLLGSGLHWQGNLLVKINCKSRFHIRQRGGKAVKPQDK